MLGSLRHYAKKHLATQGRVQPLSREGQIRHYGGSNERPPQRVVTWWAVDGEMFKASEFDPCSLLDPHPNDQVSEKKRRTARIVRLGHTRLYMKAKDQEKYWSSYMTRFQTMREQWEKLYWEPGLEDIITPSIRARIRRDHKKQESPLSNPRREYRGYGSGPPTRRINHTGNFISTGSRFGGYRENEGYQRRDTGYGDRFTRDDSGGYHENEGYQRRDTGYGEKFTRGDSGGYRENEGYQRRDTGYREKFTRDDSGTYRRGGYGSGFSDNHRGDDDGWESGNNTKGNSGGYRGSFDRDDDGGYRRGNRRDRRVRPEDQVLFTPRTYDENVRDRGEASKNVGTLKGEATKNVGTWRGMTFK